MKFKTIVTALSATFFLFFSSCSKMPFKIKIEKNNPITIIQSSDNQLITKEVAMSNYVLNIAGDKDVDISGYVLDAKEEDNSERGFQGYKVLDASSFLPRGDTLREAVLNPNSFTNNGMSKQCGFSPSLGFKFKSNSGQVFYLLMDFSCHVAKFYDSKPSLLQVRDFENAKTQLKVFAEKTFGQSFKDRQNENYLPKKGIRN
jgi:hypothetical protein